ncbi:MAG: Flp pilus assembly complex ATPase component TadA [Ruminococcus sp.]|nr:Flp pilus assembly complex ATPase component TadA [Ruminococcus sp.]
MKRRTSFETVRGYLPLKISSALELVRETDRRMISEIRLRAGRPVSLTYPDGSRFLTSAGRLTMSPSNAECVMASAEDISSSVEKLCRFSLYSCTRELTEGWFVLPGGIRVGLAGTVSETGTGLLRDISSLNFRLAREVIGCGEEIYKMCGSDAGILISGGVNSGKTTVLRDLCRIYGNTFKTALIDERSEIASSSGGLPSNDVGALTDILTGCKRSSGITAALRTLSPDMIFCDEIASEEDAEAILSAHGSGVRFAATIHAVSYTDLISRKIASMLLSNGVFTHIVILSGSNSPSQISEIRRISENA